MGRTIAAGLFILRKDFKLLICHPTNHAKDFFSIPKGKVEEGENHLEAAFRETYEETNLDLKDDKNFKIFELDRAIYSHKKKILYPFLCLENHDSTFDWENTEIKCNSNVPEDRGGFPEMDGYEWVTLNKAKGLLHNTQVVCIPKILEIILK